MRRIILAAIALTAALAGPPAFAAQPYPFDLPKMAPIAMAAWRKAVPAAFQKVGWIGDFAGVGLGPVESHRIDRVEFLIGSVCKPHDCADNRLAFAIAVDGSAAYGLLRARTPRADNVVIGGPAPAALRALLAQRLAP
jgi:hypothetical protein